MMGPRQVDQAALFYEFSLERHVPAMHLLRSIDRFVDLSAVRSHVAPFYSSTGRPSIDPELLIRMLLVGYCYGIRSERRLCEEVHLNLAYRWFCRLGTSNAWAEFAGLFRSTRSAFLDHERAKTELKSLMPEDAKEAVGHGVRAKRSKSGAVSFDLLDMEAGHASLQ